MDVVYAGNYGESFTNFPEHRHGYWEIILNCKGCGTMTVAGRDYSFSPGDIAVIPPNTPHKKTAVSGFSDICMFINNFRPIGREAFHILKDDDAHSAEELMKMASRYCSDKNIYGQAVLNAAGDLLYQLLVYFYNSNRERDLRLEGILELMQNQVTNPDFDLSQALETSGYHKGYFRQIFKQAMGQSPVSYFLHMRIEYAKSLMNQYDTSRSIKDIAHSCGFKDPLYFSRVFKKFEGIAPQTYIQKQKQHDIGLIDIDTSENIQ